MLVNVSSKVLACSALSFNDSFSPIIVFICSLLSSLINFFSPLTSIYALPFSSILAVFSINSFVSLSTANDICFLIFVNFAAFLEAVTKLSNSIPVASATFLSLCISIADISNSPVSLLNFAVEAAALATSSVNPAISLRAIYINLNGSPKLAHAPPNTCNCADISTAPSISNSFSAIPVAKFISTPNLVVVSAIF